MQHSAVSMKIDSKITLNDGVQMPLLGLGVYQSPPGPITQNAVRIALKLGYRHIDTAAIYGNEIDVGQALVDSGIPRDQVFITTKLWNGDQGYDSAIAASESSLKKLGLKYLDMYLIHWPVPGLRNESWKAMTALLGEGKTRSIGVSNFTVDHLKKLLETTDKIPAVNQVEFHPFLYQKQLLDYCNQKDIRLEAYAPLTRGEKLNDETVRNLAVKYSKSPAQVLIRWGLQHGLIVIPKSVKEERIRENSNVFDFEISVSDMKKLDSLNEDFRTCWDPTDVV